MHSDAKNMIFRRGVWLFGVEDVWKREERKKEREGREAGSGAQPRRSILKSGFYPASGPRWALSFVFLDSSHRDLPAGEVSARSGARRMVS